MLTHDFYLFVVATWDIGCYVAVDQKVDVRGALSRVGLLRTHDYDEAVTNGEEDKDRSWMERFLSGGSSTLALAFLCNKALFPVRTPITIALTPAVARFLRRRNMIKGQ